MLEEGTMVCMTQDRRLIIRNICKHMPKNGKSRNGALHESVCPEQRKAFLAYCPQLADVPFSHLSRELFDPDHHNAVGASGTVGAGYESGPFRERPGVAGRSPSTQSSSRAGDQQRDLAECRHRVRPLGGLPIVPFCCAPGSGVVVVLDKGVSNCSA